MILTTSAAIPGKKIVKSITIVRGNTIRARNIGSDLIAGIKNLVGGEIQEYTKLFGEAREQAMDRMIEQARELGANAIVDVRFSTSYIMQNAAEILAYGTAVMVEDDIDN